MSKEYIYMLLCDGHPFYVGRTKRPLHKRLSDHLSASSTETSAKAEFICKSLLLDQEITIEHLETLTEPYTCEEDLWLERLEAAGHTLVNSKRGDNFIDEVQLRADIQEAKKQWKKPKKKSYPPVGKPPSEQELELLNTLYETDRQQFERLGGMRKSDPEKYREELMKIAKTHSDITVRYTAEMIAEPSCVVDGKDHLKELDVILEEMKNENKN